MRGRRPSRVFTPTARRSFDLGAKAAKWADKIRNPKNLLDKLGVKPEHRVVVARRHATRRFSPSFASARPTVSTRRRQATPTSSSSAPSRSTSLSVSSSFATTSSATARSGPSRRRARAASRTPTSWPPARRRPRRREGRGVLRNAHRHQVRDPEGAALAMLAYTIALAVPMSPSCRLPSRTQTSRCARCRAPSGVISRTRAAAGQHVALPDDVHEVDVHLAAGEPARAEALRHHLREEARRHHPLHDDVREAPA